MPQPADIQLRIEDLPAAYREVFDIISPVAGEAAALEIIGRIADELGGMTIYLPKKEKLNKAARDRRIKKNFNGANLREIAKEENLTLSSVRGIATTK
jgi:Mor family transcriptional regulator